MAWLDDVSAVYLHAAVGFDELGKNRIFTMPVRILLWDAVVVHHTDGHQVSQHGGSSVVVAVEVSGYEMVDLLYARHLCGYLVYAPGIAGARVARVDEEGFAGRRDDKRRSSALDVYPVHVECAFGLDECCNEQE